jgi:hypothetical protein
MRMALPTSTPAELTAHADAAVQTFLAAYRS